MMKRRQFVATPLFLAATMAADRCGASDIAGGILGHRDPRRPVRAAGTAFGTTISLLALAPEGDRGAEHTRDVLRRAMREVQCIDAQMSLFRADSQLSVLNRTGRLDRAHPHVLRNLHFARELGDATQGAFDITVQPLWDLFARARDTGGLPDAREIRRARALVDYRALSVSGDRVRIERPGTRVTLNSIAQGYAVDVVLEMLRGGQLDAALIDTGEIGNLGKRDVAHPWTIGIQHPRERESLIGLLAMDGRVVSTSGDYSTTFSPDFRNHHIFDPATGRSPSDFASTVVLAKSGLVADGLSTALMVMDRASGVALMRRYPGCDALWIDKQARMDHTPGTPMRA